MDVEKVMIMNPPSIAPAPSHAAVNAKENKTADKKLDKAVEIDYNNPIASDKTRELTDKRAEKQSGEQNSEELISKVVQDANKLLKGSRRNLEYSIHEATHQIMVKVVNSDTGEVIREIPPEKALDIMAKIWELAGLFVDEKS